MINLSQYEFFWKGLIREAGIRSAFFLTSESDIQPRLGDISSDAQPFLMVIIPSAKTSGSSQDDVADTNYGLIYVLSKEDRTASDTFTIQKELQPVMENVKKLMIDSKEQCGVMRGLDVSSFHTDPESKLFSRATGWSLSFNFETNL